MVFALGKFEQEEMSVSIVLQVGVRSRPLHKHTGSTFESRRKPKASTAEVNAEVSFIRLVTSAIFNLPLVTVSLLITLRQTPPLTLVLAPSKPPECTRAS